MTFRGGALQPLGQQIERICSIRSSKSPFVINGLIIAAARTQFVFFIEGDEGHLGVGAEAVIGLEQYGYHYSIEEL
jgi:hypothetical protein